MPRLLFSEYYPAHGGTKEEARNDYLMYGGMPYVVSLPVDDKVKYLTELHKEIYLKDIRERYGITNSSGMEVWSMEIKDILKILREEKKLTQDELAKHIMVTRQAVSCWENGETQPNTDTLKLLSREFNVSINTLLGSPRQLVCQCCGMPLNEDGMISKEPDGNFNEEYCKWCYTNGEFAYKSKDTLLDFLISHMPNPDNLSEDERRAQYDGYLSQLKHWR